MAIGRRTASEAKPARKADIREPEGKSSWPLGQRRRSEPDFRKAKTSPVGRFNAKGSFFPWKKAKKLTKAVYKLETGLKNCLFSVKASLVGRYPCSFSLKGSKQGTQTEISA